MEFQIDRRESSLASRLEAGHDVLGGRRMSKHEEDIEND